MLTTPNLYLHQIDLRTGVNISLQTLFYIFNRFSSQIELIITQ